MKRKLNSNNREIVNLNSARPEGQPEIPTLDSEIQVKLVVLSIRRTDQRINVPLHITKASFVRDYCRTQYLGDCQWNGWRKGVQNPKGKITTMQ